MSRLWNNLFANSKKSPRRSQPKRTWLQVEDLEQRSVPTVILTPGSVSGHFNLTISDDQNSNDTLTIIDTDNPIVGTQITLNGANFFFGRNTIDSITVSLGNGNDIINVEFTNAPLTMNLGSGTDTVNISPTYKDLSTILGSVDISGGPGADTLNVNNQNGPGTCGWNVTQSSISATTLLTDPVLPPEEVVATIDYSNLTNIALHGSGLGDTFTVVSPLPSSPAGSFSVDGGGGNSTLILDDHSDPQGIGWFVDGNNVACVGGELIDGVPNPAVSVTNYSNVANLVLNGGSGGNTFTLSATTQNLGDLPGTTNTVFSTQTGSLTVHGGAGSNTLILDDQNNPNDSSWSVTGNNVTRSFIRRLGLIQEQVSTSINYSNMANLELHAGKGNDAFTLSPTAQNLAELPGTSISSSAFGRGTPGSVTVDGGTGSNTLILDDQSDAYGSSWSVSGNNVTRSFSRALGLIQEQVSTSINYSNVANLELHAGKGGATFTLSPTKQDLDELPGTTSTISPPSSLTADGGSGANTLILDDQNNPNSSAWSVTGSNVMRSYSRSFLVHVSFSIHYSNVSSLILNGGNGGNTFVVSGTPSGQVSVNGGTGANKLKTDNADHTITLTGHNAGSYANVSFANIGSLAGGSGVDIFKFMPLGQLDGTIDGGGAPAGQGDWLDYSARTTAVTVNLATGSATSVAGGMRNIQNVIGSAGDDTLSGNTLGNILIGGAGTNLLTGGSGRNLLIGGNGKSTIVGGADDDILIAGTTTFDANEVALMSILKEWERTDKTYQQRITDLRSGGGFNGSNKLILGTTVLDDDGACTLTGNGGLNWFFADLSGGVKDTITDLKQGKEQVN